MVVLAWGRGGAGWHWHGEEEVVVLAWGRGGLYWHMDEVVVLVWGRGGGGIGMGKRWCQN